MKIFYCETCGIEHGFPKMGIFVKAPLTCGLCELSKENLSFIDTDQITKVILKGIPEQVNESIDKKVASLSLFETEFGGVIDLEELSWISAVRFDLYGISVTYDYRLKNVRDSFNISRYLSDAEKKVIELPTKKGRNKETDTLIFMDDGTQVSYNAVTNNREILIRNKILGVKNFEKSRQKLINAWQQYKLYCENKIHHIIKLG